MQPRSFMVIITIGLLGLIPPHSVQAQDEATLSEEHLPRLSELAQAQHINGILHPAFNSAGQEESLPYVLKLALEDDWYTYWRTPGDSGLAIAFDWSASTNVKDVQIGWPAPQRMAQEGMYSFGYKGVVEMPVTVVPAEPGKAVSVKLDIMAIVCNKICVPQSLNIHHDMPAGPAIQSPYYKYTQDIARSLPARDENGDLRLQTAVLGKGGLIFSAFSKNGFEGADIFVESDDVILTALPSIEIDADNPHAAIISVAAPEGTDLTQILFSKKITATFIQGDAAIEKEFSF